MPKVVGLVGLDDDDDDDDDEDDKGVDEDEPLSDEFAFTVSSYSFVCAWWRSATSV